MRYMEVKAAVAARDTQVLARALDDRRLRIRASAIEALQEMGSTEAKDVLADHAFRTDHVTSQGMAAGALDAMGDARATGAYLAVVKDGWSHDMLSDAAKAIGRLRELAEAGDPDVAAGLVQIMRDKPGEKGPWGPVCQTLVDLGDQRVQFF